MKYRKKNPDPFAFAPLNRKSYEQAGTIEYKPLATSVLSRLVAGTTRNDKTYTTTTGRIFQVDRKTCWCSRRTIRQDYASGTGIKVTGSKVDTAIRWLERNGLVRDLGNAIPETNGRYGKIFQIPDFVLDVSDDMVNVLKEHRLFTYGKIADYRFSGRRIEYSPEEYTRQVHADNRIWRRNVEQNGFSNGAYITTGQWRFGDVGEANATVFCPWIVVDIDRTFYPDAHADTLTAISDFESAGFDQDSMYVSFSGSKGFHILLATSVFGYPIFRSSRDASSIFGDLLRGWTDVEFDSSTLNPLQVYRISGSRNLKSGLYKRTYTLGEFDNLALETLYANAKDPGCWKWPTKMGEVEAEMVELLRTSANNTLKSNLKNKKRRSNLGYNLMGKTLNQIVSGIGEGDSFGNDHEGRNKAAYIFSCFILEHPKQHEQVRNALGINGRHDFDNPDLAYQTLQYWYDNRVDKGTHAVKLKNPFNSAQRTITKKYGR